MSVFIDGHGERFGVEPICQTLGVSASAYYQRATGQRSARAVEDERLLAVIEELHGENYYAYGPRRMWKALLRSGERLVRSRVERLMRQNGIQSAKRRGKPWRTTSRIRRRCAALTGSSVISRRPVRMRCARRSGGLTTRG